MRNIEPEELAKHVTNMLTNDDLFQYVLEDLTDYYSDLLHDSPYEYKAELEKFYSDDI